MAEEKDSEEEGVTEGFFRNLPIFVAAFVGLILVFMVVRPLFFVDWIEPFIDWFGLHNFFRFLVVGMDFVYNEFGIFLFFLVVVFLGWVVFSRQHQAESAKPAKK